MKSRQVLSSRCDFASHFLSIDNVKMHYYDEGEGDPLLFLHGIPTSAYLWRNVIPVLKPVARCIAPDFIGMGKSSKPSDCAYRIVDHIQYLDAFISQLGLNRITLVLHGWGSVAGFDFARRHPDKIKGLVFYESHIRPVRDWNDLSLPIQQLATLLRNPKASHRAIVDQNYLVEKLLPAATIRSLSEEEMAHYREPFATPSSRAPLWQYVNELPLGNGPSDVIELIARYSKWLQETPKLKLMLYAVPGFMTPIAEVSFAKHHFKNLTLVALDDVLHFAPESAPLAFANTILSWYQKL